MGSNFLTYPAVAFVSEKRVLLLCVKWPGLSWLGQCSGLANKTIAIHLSVKWLGLTYHNVVHEVWSSAGWQCFATYNQIHVEDLHYGISVHGGRWLELRNK